MNHQTATVEIKWQITLNSQTGKVQTFLILPLFSDFVISRTSSTFAVIKLHFFVFVAFIWMFLAHWYLLYHFLFPLDHSSKLTVVFHGASTKWKETSAPPGFAPFMVRAASPSPLVTEAGAQLRAGTHRVAVETPVNQVEVRFCLLRTVWCKFCHQRVNLKEAVWGGLPHSSSLTFTIHL